MRQWLMKPWTLLKSKRLQSGHVTLSLAVAEAWLPDDFAKVVLCQTNVAGGIVAGSSLHGSTSLRP
jgi:hypothetical protein